MVVAAQSAGQGQVQKAETGQRPRPHILAARNTVVVARLAAEQPRP